MKFIFIDETSNKKKAGFYGLCGVSVDEAYYASLVREITKCFKDKKWNPDIEFKGSYLFSHSKGDPNVTVDERIKLTDQIIASNIAQKNAKLKAVFVWNEARDTAQNHLFLTKRVLCGLLPSRASRLKDKPCIVFADRNDKIRQKELGKLVCGTLEGRNYRLVEDVNIFNEWRATHIGLCLCDLIAYLASWRCLSSTPKEAQRSLFSEEAISQYDSKKAEIVERIFQNLKDIKIKSSPLKH